MVVMNNAPRPSNSSHVADYSRVNTESVHVVAQSMTNLPPISDAAAFALAPDVEYRLREIIQDALKFMKHAKRSRMMPNDINAALRLRNIEPIYGFGSRKRKRSSEDERRKPIRTEAMAQSGSGALGAAGDMDSRTAFRQVEGNPDLFFCEEMEESVKSILQLPIPELPLEVTASAHWLAVDGIQPAIAQNPTKRVKKLSFIEGDGNVQTKDRSAVGQLNPQPGMKHELSRELQLYFEEVIRAVHGEDNTKLHAFLASVAEEPGIVQLLPYFSVHIENTVSSAIRNLRLLLRLMLLVDALLRNKEFDLQTYLHQLLPPILSCIVGKRLCVNPRDNHWVLRDFAATLIQKICAAYGSSYPTLQPRITKNFMDALSDLKRPLTTHYGAIVGTASLGRQVVDVLLLPRLASYADKIKKLLMNSKATDIRRMEGTKVLGALVWALSVPRVPARSSAGGTFAKDSRNKDLVKPCVQVSRQRFVDLIPGTDTLVQNRHQELGSKFYPYGEFNSHVELVNAVSQDTSLKK